jgi:hypothetical protein
MIKRYSKAFGALLGALTPAAVVTVLAMFDVHVDVTLAAGICTVCGTIATIAFPANATKPAAVTSAPTPTPPVS